MFRRAVLSVIALLSAGLPSFAQTPWQFRWQKGQTLTYKIKHNTSVVEVVDKTTNTSSSALELVNRWEVTDLDNKGVATMTMTLVSMRNEQKRGSGDALLFDSQNLDKSTPELREQMKKYIGATVAQLRVDGYGRVVDVKQGNAATFDAEPPFVVVFPAANAEAGQAWRRPFNLVLDPPYGTGEKYEAEQRYECKAIAKNVASINVSTTFKTMPDNARERVPMLQKEVQGRVFFNVARGVLISAELNIDKMLENHQGKDSTYRFKSEYYRELVE